MKRLILLGLLLACCVDPAFANNNRIDSVGTRSGSVALSVALDGPDTDDWTDFASEDLTSDQSAAALASGLAWQEVCVWNTHADQSLYLMLGPGVGAVTNHRRILPGTSACIPVRGLFTVITTISLRGTGAATTGQLWGVFVPAGT